MILILTATAVFIGGLAVGVLAMVVIGIHAEQHRSARIGGQANTLTGAASRRLGLLSARVTDSADPERDQVRR